MTAMAALACLFCAVVQAVPIGYSINSDSPTANADSLYQVDLANGSHTRIGTVTSFGQTLIDVEGLAFAPDGTLYGLDDDSATLFPINTNNGVVVGAQKVYISGMPTGGGNDFGMTFGCDGNLYVTSVKSQTLFRMSLDGTAIPVGATGSLGANISAIAAYGNPVQLYGLGNGLDGDNQVDSRTLYAIDTETGTVTALGTLGGGALDYHQAGLAFDETGMLWAITDRRAVPGGPFGSQVIRINTSGGDSSHLASAIASTSEMGFESLAISPPRGCFQGGEGGETAQFAVSKQFMDHNNLDGATFTLSCNTGLPLEQTITVDPHGGAYEDLQVTFVVRDFETGTLDCQLSEQLPTGYQASYSCDGESACSAGSASPLDPYFQGPCSFTDVELDDDNICFIRNYVAPASVDVTKQWIDENPEFQGPTNAHMAWACVNARSSGNDLSLGSEEGDLYFHLPEETIPFTIYPNFDPDYPTVCSVTEDFPGFDSDIESFTDDCQGLMVALGGGANCTVVNTRLYEGIPTLGEYGKLLLALLMLAAGLVAARRLQ